MKIALLSNTNMDFVVRQLRQSGTALSVYETEGYGNELGMLLDDTSSYHAFAPEITFLVEDLMELLEHDLDPVNAKRKVESWFAEAESALRADGIYYISDAYLWGAELEVVQESGRKAALEQIWQARLESCAANHANVRILPYRHMIEKLGEEAAFSLKMWYMGRILLSMEAQKRLCACILEKVEAETGTPRKVLLLDLDNTLWGGLAGEAMQDAVKLSEEHTGLAYKNFQRVILQMQRQGVLLGIVSKNNEEDAMEILSGHPHMVLLPECFAARKINWKEKHENILEIAKELNLGVDSFVFFDDNPAERALVRELLPEVAVPDFPEKAEELAPAMTEIYRKYFAKPVLTDEDREKTAQYAANARRSELKNAASNFEEYLQQLQITLGRVKPERFLERMAQLVNKTNQFNLTTKRYTQAQLQQMLEDTEKRIYLYRSADRFGDNGVVAVVIVDMRREIPIVEEFAMSCRVMGRRLEYAIIEDVEQDIKAAGFCRLRGVYLPTQKNRPVEGLYRQLGYRLVREQPDGEAVYEIEMAQTPERVYYVEKEADADERKSDCAD